MAMPALKFEQETPVEERVAILEANVGHIRSDIADMKIDIRKLNDKMDGMDQRLLGRIDGADQKLTGKIDAVEQKLTVRSDGLKDAIVNLTLSMERALCRVEDCTCI